MDLTIHVKVELVETPALINCFSAFCDCVERCTQLLAGEAGNTVVVKSVPASVQTEEGRAAAPAALQPDAEAPSAPVAPANVEAPKKYTLDDFRNACVPLMDAQPDIVPKIQAIIKGFGVNSLMEVPAEKYGDLADKLRALGAKL